MKNAVHSAVTEDIRSIGGLIGGEAKKMDAYRASTEKRSAVRYLQGHRLAMAC